MYQSRSLVFWYLLRVVLDLLGLTNVRNADYRVKCALVYIYIYIDARLMHVYAYSLKHD